MFLVGECLDDNAKQFPEKKLAAENLILMFPFDIPFASCEQALITLNVPGTY